MKTTRSRLWAILALSSAFVAFATSCAHAPEPAQEPEAISGASQAIDTDKQLSQKDIRALALDYLRGWKLGETKDGETLWSYREMYQIATSFNNEPGLSSVEFVIDPTTMKLYASSEKGTEKTEHIKQNDSVVLYWVKQIPEEEYSPSKNDYFNSYGVQIKGKARLLSITDTNAREIAAMYMNSLYGEKKWGAIPAAQKTAIVEKLFQVNDWIEISPSEYIVNSLNWTYNKENSTRPEWYDPKSPFFGKSVRQVYYVK